MRRRDLIAALVALLVAAVVAVDVNAAARPPAKLAPPVPCTSSNRMDVFIDEDNIMYECECQMLKIGTLCAWQVIGGVDAPEARRITRSIKARYHVRAVPRLRVVAL